MTSSIDADELAAYLRVLAGNAPASAFLELRHRVSRDVLASEFFAVHDCRAMIAAIESRASRNDVYVGCAPRCRRSGTRRDVEQVWVLWAECDGAEAAAAAQAYAPEPAIVIASGSGPNVHAYWPLRAPLAPQDAEQSNFRLARTLGADEKCFDAARILRPPGTWNHKHQPCRPVTALRLEAGLSFDAREVLKGAREINDDRLQHRWTDRGKRNISSDPLLRVNPQVYVRELLGVHARPGRKVHCPFHADEHPSLHVYPSAERGWCCFSCGRGGSVYDLAAALWGMDTRGRDFVDLRRLLTKRFETELSLAPGPASIHRRHLVD